MALPSIKGKFAKAFLQITFSRIHRLHQKVMVRSLCGSLCLPRKKITNERNHSCFKSSVFTPEVLVARKLESSVDNAASQNGWKQNITGTQENEVRTKAPRTSNHPIFNIPLESDASSQEGCRSRDSFIRHGYRDLKGHRDVRKVSQARKDSTTTHLHGDAGVQLLDVYTNASGRHGLGCIWGRRWIVGQWDKEWLTGIQPCVELLEMKSILVAVLTWGYAWAGCRVQLHCDNLMVVECFNERVRPNKKVREIFRCIKLAVLECQFELVLVHADKTFVHFQGTDSLSRLDLDRFHKLLPNMNGVPDSPPSNLEFLLPDVWESICVSMRLKTTAHRLRTP